MKPTPLLHDRIGKKFLCEDPTLKMAVVFGNAVLEWFFLLAGLLFVH